MKLRSAAILAATGLLIAGCSSADPGNGNGTGGDKVITIGFAGGLTGEASVGDVPTLAGMEYGVHLINEAGGVAGYTLRLISKDMQSDATLGGTVAQELVDDGADVLVGPAFAGMATGVLQVAQSEGIPVLAGCATQPEYTYQSGADVYLAAFGDNVQAAAVAEYVLAQGMRSAYVMASPDMSYTANSPTFFSEAFERGGGTVAGQATYSIGQTDFSAQVTDIASMKDDIDVIFAPTFPPDLPNMVRALRAAGVTTPFVGLDGFHTDESLEAGQAALEGTIFATHAFDEPGSSFAEWVDAAIAYDATVADAPALAGLGYTNVQIIAAAIEAAASADPSDISAAIGALSGLDTVTGVITYQGTGGIPKKSVSIGGVEGGAFVHLETFIPDFIPEP